MEYSRTEIRPGVWLTHLREDKFKTACFSVSLLSQLNRETASMNALIPFVLRRGTSAFPDMETLSARMEELYGTVIEPIIRSAPGLCGERAGQAPGSDLRTHEQQTQLCRSSLH